MNTETPTPNTPANTPFLTAGVKSDLLQGCDWIDAHNKRMVKHGSLDIPDEGSRLRISKHMRVVTEAARGIPALKERIAELEKELRRIEARDARMIAETHTMIDKLEAAQPTMKVVVNRALVQMASEQPTSQPVNITSLDQAEKIIHGG